jgi:hypothetical protein
MMPDKDIAELTRLVSDYFETSDNRMVNAALQLQDEGWVWDQIRPFLANVWRAGWCVGYDAGLDVLYEDGEGVS